MRLKVATVPFRECGPWKGMIFLPFKKQVDPAPSLTIGYPPLVVTKLSQKFPSHHGAYIEDHFTIAL